MRKTFQFLMLLLTGLIATGTLCANTIRQFYIEGKKFPGYSCQEFGASLNYVSSEPSPHCGFLCIA